MAPPMCLRAATKRALFFHPFFRRSFALAAVEPSRTNRDLGQREISKDSPKSTPLKADSVPFSSLSDAISPETLKAITVKPFTFTYMSAVQASVLPLLPKLAEPFDESHEHHHTRDLLVRAKTGTGKTLAFLVPAIEARRRAINAHATAAVAASGLSGPSLLEKAGRQFARENVGTLIISPTRELATQIANEAMKLTHHHEGFEVRLFVGGQSKGQQMRDWMRGRKDIVVTTPGRILDFLQVEKDMQSGISKTQLVFIQAFFHDLDN